MVGSKDKRAWGILGILGILGMMGMMGMMGGYWNFLAGIVRY